MTPAQQTLVLEQIAGRMATLNDLLMLAQATTTDSERVLLIDAAQALAELIGGMADDATGAGVRGDMHYWLYGSQFDAAPALTVPGQPV